MFASCGPSAVHSKSDYYISSNNTVNTEIVNMVNMRILIFFLVKLKITRLANYLNGSPPLSKSTIASPPPVFGDVTALTGLRADLPPDVPGELTCPPTNSDLPRNVLFDLASNNLTVSLTLDLGLGGIAGFVPGDFKGFFTSGVTGVCLMLEPPTPAEEAL